MMAHVRLCSSLLAVVYGTGQKTSEIGLHQADVDDLVVRV